MLKLLYPWETAESVFSIDYQKLYDLGFRAILFDIDNTLVHHGADSTPKVDALFRAIHAIGLKTLLLTNNDEARVRRFVRHIDTPYLCEAGKPSPAGYRRAMAQLGAAPAQTLCIGDQLFTDILGANRCGIASILVRYLRLPGETHAGRRRAAERAVLACYRHSRFARGRLGGVETRPAAAPRRRLFCERGPLCYAISEQKEILLRHLRNLTDRASFARTRQTEPLPCVVSAQSARLIKQGKGIDPRLQENKAVNIRLACARIHGLVLRPGETFSFWRTVGKVTRRRGYRDGRILIGNRICAGLGGGLCNLANLLHRLVLDSPLEATEFHSHSDALAPDGDVRVPFSSGTSVSYNYIDYRFCNVTDQCVQLLTWCDAEYLHAELRSERPFPLRFALVEEDHHFIRENGRYYRVSKIYKTAVDRATGDVVSRQLVLDNHSEVLYDDSLIPAALIRA